MYLCTRIMRNNDLQKEKERDLLAAYERVKSVQGVNFKYLNQMDIANLIAEMPAPRFYINEDWAYQLVRLYKNGKISGKHKEIAEDLVSHYDRLKMQYPREKVRCLCILAVLCPAKSFYTSAARIKDIIFFEQFHKHGK